MSEHEYETKEFTSAEEAITFLRQSREDSRVLTEVLTEEQQGVTWGSCWARFWKDLVVFGRVETQEELRASEMHGIADISDPDEREMALAEVEAILRVTIRNEADGFLYGWCHSAIEPGELGTTHRASMWPISEALYRHAEEHGWDPDTFRPIYRLELAQAYARYRLWATDVASTVLADPPGGERP